MNSSSSEAYVGTSTELFNRLLDLLQEQPGVSVAGYVGVGIPEPELSACIVNNAAPKVMDAAVLVAKQELLRAGQRGLSWVESGPSEPEIAELVRDLSELGVFVFVAIVPEQDRQEDVTVYLAKAPRGELAKSGADNAVLLLLDTEISLEWQEMSSEDRFCLFEPARFDPQALPV